MFSGCFSLINLDLSNFNTSNFEKIQWMFANCDSLKKITVSKDGDTKNKIFEQLNKDVGEWEKSEDNGKVILTKKQ